MTTFLNEIEDNNEKYAVDSAIKFLTKSISRPTVFIETIRKRRS